MGQRRDAGDGQMIEEKACKYFGSRRMFQVVARVSNCVV